MDPLMARKKADPTQPTQRLARPKNTAKQAAPRRAAPRQAAGADEPRRGAPRQAASTGATRRPPAKRSAGGGASTAPTRRPAQAGSTSSDGFRKWLPAGAAAAVVAVLVGAGIAGSNDSDATTSATLIDSTSSMVTTTSAAPSVIIETSAPVVKTQLSSTLRVGSSGSEVTQVQTRLTELGFRPGKADGVYGNLTKMAVWAYQKLVQGIPRLEASGKVDNATWQLMQDPTTIEPRRPGSGTHLEIYLDRQVAVIFKDNQPAFISHTSSGQLDAQGKPKQWCEDVTYTETAAGELLDEPRRTRECAYAKTPGGVFTVDRKVDGVRNSVLGGMRNPVYFNYGIAIHGGYNVPNYPDSHGCVRVPNDISHEVYELLNRGDRVYVWDGIKEPEQQSKSDRLPSFNAVDKEWLATSTSSSTTTSTTIAPSTTLHPTTTPHPTAAPTTKAPPTTAAPTTATPTTATPTTAAPTTAAVTTAP